MTSQVIYNGNLRTTMTHLRSGQQVITDAPLDNNGKGEAFSPTDLVATALASCMMTIMGIRARDNQIDIEGTRADVNKIMAENPRRIARIEVTFTMPDKGYTDEEKELLQKAALGCPVCRSLGIQCEQAVTFRW